MVGTPHYIHKFIHVSTFMVTRIVSWNFSVKHLIMGIALDSRNILDHNNTDIHVSIARSGVFLLTYVNHIARIRQLCYSNPTENTSSSLLALVLIYSWANFTVYGRRAGNLGPETTSRLAALTRRLR